MMTKQRLGSSTLDAIFQNQNEKSVVLVADHFHKIKMDNIELFETEELSTQYFNLIKSGIELEESFRTLEILQDYNKRNELTKHYGKVLEFLSANYKQWKLSKEVFQNIGLIYSSKEALLKCYLDHTICKTMFDFDENTKFVLKRREGLRVDNLPINEYPGITTAKEKLSREFNCFLQLIGCLRDMENLNFLGTLVNMTNLKKLIREWQNKKDSNMDERRIKFFNNFHYLLVSKMHFLFEPELRQHNMLPSSEPQTKMNEINEHLQKQGQEKKRKVIDLELNGKHDDSLVVSQRWQLSKGSIIIYSSNPSFKTEIQDLEEYLESKESEETLENYMKTNKEIKSGKSEHDFFYIFLTKISSNWYLGMHTRKYRGKKVEEILQEITLFANIMNNSDIMNLETNLLTLLQTSRRRKESLIITSSINLSK